MRRPSVIIPAELSGRQYDLLAIPTTATQIATGSTQYTDFAAAIITGPVKLAQRWAITILTVRGSMGFHLQEVGSDLLPELQNGGANTEADVQAIFQYANEQVRQQMAVEDAAGNYPQDEIFDSAELLEVDAQPSYLSIHVKITSAAGETAEVQLPVTLTPSAL